MRCITVTFVGGRGLAAALVGKEPPGVDDVIAIGVRRVVHVEEAP